MSGAGTITGDVTSETIATPIPPNRPSVSATLVRRTGTLRIRRRGKALAAVIAENSIGTSKKGLATESRGRRGRGIPRSATAAVEARRGLDTARLGTKEHGYPARVGGHTKTRAGTAKAVTLERLLPAVHRLGSGIRTTTATVEGSMGPPMLRVTPEEWQNHLATSAQSAAWVVNTARAASSASRDRAAGASDQELVLRPASTAATQP